MILVFFSSAWMILSECHESPALILGSIHTQIQYIYQFCCVFHPPWGRYHKCIHVIPRNHFYNDMHAHIKLLLLYILKGMIQFGSNSLYTYIYHYGYLGWNSYTCTTLDIGEITPSYSLHTRTFGTYLLGGLFALQKKKR
jgi:hypothetical protein